jgi:hypothetical protein
MEIICDNCSGKFKKSKSHALRQKKNFCCRVCWLNYDESYNKNFFSKIDSEEKAYWLGFICADGWLDKRDKCLGILLQRKDRNHLIKFSNIFNIEVKDYKSNQYENSRCMVYSKTVYNDLIKMGILPRKSNTDDVKVFSFIPMNLLNHFIRGWFDGDGSIYHEKKKFHPRINIVGTELCLTKIRDILVTNIGCNNIKICKHKSIFSICWGDVNQIISIRDWLYKDSNIFLERKKNIFDILKSVAPKGSSIYRGVIWIPKTNKWYAGVSHKNRRIHLGSFETEVEAAKAYDSALESLNMPLYKRNFIKIVVFI